MSSHDLLSRRLVFTVGKGGVGRTTVTIALALEAARRGRRVLVIELEGARGLEHALEAQRESREPGVERISYMAVDGRRALEEYLELIIPVRRLLRTLFQSTIYQYFVAAAPGLKELMAVGKIWYEADRSKREGDGKGPDLVVVDAPATGHSLQYLRMPQAALEAFPVGLVHREAERVLTLMRDPSQTGIVIVSTAEEMPVNETIEMFTGLSEIGLPCAGLVVNQVHEAPLEEGELERLRARATSADAAEDAPGRQVFQEAVRRAEEECGWAKINAANLERLAAAVKIPTAVFPAVFCEEFGAEQIQSLSKLLMDQLEPKRAARGVRR